MHKSKETKENKRRETLKQNAKKILTFIISALSYVRENLKLSRRSRPARSHWRNKDERELP